jgi:very-short-patch-repair endonuclease
MTLPEVVLWQRIRRGGLKGVQFRRQHPIGPYILDFFCPASQLAVEIDGAAHGSVDQARHDQHRDHWLAARNIRVMRIPASDVLRDESLENVLEAIARVAAPSTASGGPPPP